MDKEEFIRDICKVIPMSKSEAKRRLDLIIQQAEQEVMKRVVKEIKDWTPKEETGFYVGGVRAMTLDDHKRKFSREILQAVNSPKITNLDKEE